MSTTQALRGTALRIDPRVRGICSRPSIAKALRVLFGMSPARPTGAETPIGVDCFVPVQRAGVLALEAVFGAAGLNVHC
jgi:hypothetical protein